MIELRIARAAEEALKELYSVDIQVDTANIQRTRKDFVGDYTLVVFPFVKAARKSPEQVANELGEALSQKLNCSFNVVKGFLNLSFSDSYWLGFVKENLQNEHYGFAKPKDTAPVLIEFSSPNTNKPLHLGHIRNNLLGDAVARILKANGQNVVKVNLVNDRGIHICKSMLAWKKFGKGETPESANMKGDHLVGKYYVEFDKHYKEEVQLLVNQGVTEEEAAKKAPLLLEAQSWLKRWENGDEEIRTLWQTMNGWVYNGFDKTYAQLGIEFDKTYYESETYLLGKQLVEEGLQRGALTKKADGSVWADLTNEGLDEKLLLRADGTSVYMTQDLGTAQLRYNEFLPQKMIYVVGNEQNYHFDVLKLVLSKKLEKPYGDHIFHLSYGMVELPSGKMKSREGTVVDADDLMAAMVDEAKERTRALGKTTPDNASAEQLYSMIGLGALKYFILKVDPKKNMLFNPEESIDFNGNTAPFIQYTHARIKSLLRKAEAENLDLFSNFYEVNLQIAENELVKSLYEFPKIINSAAESFSPALIANYCFDLAKSFNRFYQETPIFKEEDNALKITRLQISKWVATTLQNGMSLLGIGVPEEM